MMSSRVGAVCRVSQQLVSRALSATAVSAKEMSARGETTNVSMKLDPNVEHAKKVEKFVEEGEETVNSYYDGLHDEKRRSDLENMKKVKLSPPGMEFVKAEEETVNNYYDGIHDEQRREAIEKGIMKKVKLSQPGMEFVKAEEETVNNYYDGIHDEQRREAIEKGLMKKKINLKEVDPEEFVPKAEEMINHYYDDQHDVNAPKLTQILSQNKQKPSTNVQHRK